MPIINASAHLYFTKESLVQHLMHQLKYRGNKELGLQLGRLMGHALKNATRFNEIEALVPLPLFCGAGFARNERSELFVIVPLSRTNLNSQNDSKTPF